MPKRNSGSRTPQGRQSNAPHQRTTKSKKKRASRNAARRVAAEKFGAAAIKGKDVIHKDGNALNNSPSNIGLSSKTKNRSFSRNKKAGKVNKKD